MPQSIHALPPGPRSPAIVQSLHYAHDPLGFFEGHARRYGTPFTVRWSGFGTFVMLADGDSIRDIFRGDPHALHSGEANSFLSLSIGPSSVLVLDEEAHARQRRVLVPPMKGERMRAFFDAMKAATRDAARAWPRGRPVPVLPAMRQITLRVILQAVLGLPVGPELSELEYKVERVLAAGRMTRYSIVLLPYVPHKLVANSRWVPFFRQLRALDEALYAFIAKRRRQPAGAEDVLTDLLAATHEDGQPMTDAEIRDAVLTMLAAGHDTTSIALAWALEQIVPRPDVAGRIADEVKQAAGGDVQAGHLDRLVYLDAAIRESMRVRTIIPFVSRLTKRPFVAGGREYPAGVTLSPNSHLVHRRPDLYPEPETFRPERFLERKFGPHEWFPFGGGNRVCLGMAFALYEMKVVLAELFATLRFRPEPSRSRPVRQGLSLGPHDGAPVVVE